MNQIDKNNEITEKVIRVGKETLRLKKANNTLEREVVETKIEVLENTAAIFVNGEKKGARATLWSSRILGTKKRYLLFPGNYRYRKDFSNLST